MPVYIMTGKLGGGKTLCSVGRIREKIEKGCTVATNLDLNPVALLGPNNKTARILRVPDKPNIGDLHAIGRGNDSYDESLNGLLVLDECGTWFNSRNWNDKARKPVNDWFLHARKLGWDVILVVQDISILDSQARSAIAEHTVFCKRLDRLAVPYFGTLFKSLTGRKLTPPKVHSARVVYGVSERDMLSDRWVFRGHDLYKAYDTKQLFLDDYPNQIYSLLTPWHIKGRHMVPRNRDFYMRMTKILWKRFASPLAFGSGALLGTSFALLATFLYFYEPPIPIPAETPQKSLNNFEEIDGYRITGSIIQGNDITYFLGIPGDDPEKPSKSYTTNKLKSLGYRVDPVSTCRVKLSYNNQEKYLTCNS